MEALARVPQCMASEPKKHEGPGSDLHDRGLRDVFKLAASRREMKRPSHIHIQIFLCNMGWDGMGWDGMGWDGMGWDGMGWDGKGREGKGWHVGGGGVGWDWDATSLRCLRLAKNGSAGPGMV